MKLKSLESGSFIYKGSYSSYLLITVLLLLLSTYSFSAEREDYDLDDNQLIEINDLGDLDEIRNNLDGTSLFGSSAGCPEVGCIGFELTADLNLDTNADGIMDENDIYWHEGLGWLPIGAEATPFSAVFDGNDHMISNLFIDRYGNNDIGLFAYLDTSNIRNVHFEGEHTYVQGSDYVGIIAGRMKQSRIEHASIDGTVRAINKAGGIVGMAFENSFILHSHSKGSVRASNASGGLVGYLRGGEIYYSTVRSSFSSSAVFASSTSGGLVGEMSGWVSISNSFSTGSISSNEIAGGLVGKAQGLSIEQEDGSTKGYLSSINSSFFTGMVRGGKSTGGLVGFLSDYANLGYSFSSGYVSGGARTSGTLIGKSIGSASISRAYWASDVSNQMDDQASQLGGIGLPINTLKCATSHSVTVDNSIDCLPALNENGEKNTLVLFNRWDIFKYIDAEGDHKFHWVFGTDQQLPGLDLNGIIYRDSDGDGALDEDDGFPLSSAAKLDSDGDGYPNNWDIECDLACQTESGFILDQFPDSPAAWLDEDFDGKPDAWAESCNVDCQNVANANGLELDLHLNDFDNDGLNDAVDPDDNADGIIDRDSDHDGLIEIHTLAELDAIRNNLQGTGFTQELGGVTDSSGCPRYFINGQSLQKCIGYELMENLDFDTNQNGSLNSTDAYYNGGLGWLPIGINITRFSAIFEGNNHTIKNLYIEREGESYVGLFSSLGNAEIRNLHIDAPYRLRGNSDVGTLVGYASNSQFENISTNSSLFSNSTSIGGLIGGAGAGNIITNCRTEGSISAGGNYVGGLVGIMGRNNSVSHSYSSVTINSYSPYTGGLIGQAGSNNIIKMSYATGTVKGRVSVGGLIGKILSSNTISTSYATGTVQGSGNQGGLIGSIDNNNTILYSYATGAVNPGSNVGGLIGYGGGGSNIISNSYWATDNNAQLTSSGSSDASNYVGVTLASLQCATSASETAATNGCVFESGNEAVDLPAAIALYNQWELAGKNNGAGEFEPYWDFGTGQQLPVLIKDGVIRRDTDADSIFDQYDVYVDIPLGDRIDTDNDGAPDFCSTYCLEEGMVADRDVDGDGVDNDQDAYPEINSSNYLDSDLDGIPDDCDLSCELLGLTTDNDDDNDLIPDAIDVFPTQFEIAIDADKDGLADAWTDVCNDECQNASEIVLDLYLNDFDNDGLVDGEGEGFDTDLFADNGLPTLITVPAEVNSTVDDEEGTFDNFSFHTSLLNSLTASDVVDDSLIFEAKYSEQVILIDPTDMEIQQLILPSGRQVITWTAIDDAGNRSTSLEQVVNVYPRVRFSTSFTEVEENTVAQIDIELTAPAPFYPVSFEVSIDEEQTTASNNDLVSSAQIDLSSMLVVSLSAGNNIPLNTQASLRLPIAQDNLEEGVERIFLSLRGASDDVNGSMYFNEIKSGLAHTLDIKAENFDDDGDGVLDINDAFSLNAAASVDTDKDGQPDSWNENCDFECYNASNLTLDLDDDNDGTPDTEDLYALNAAVAIDDDNDGLPDQWTPSCNLNCQNNSGFTLDQYPNDSDNDGLINALDSQHGVDNGKPVLTSVPAEMSSVVNSADSLHAKLNIDMASLQEFSATDVVDNSLYFRPLWNGTDLTYESGDFELPIGRQVIQWVAIDDAGNRSNPMEQIINVYPEVKFTALGSVTGEGSTAQVQFKLTGPSPVYPVKVGLKLSFEDVSADGSDIESPQNDNNYINKVHYVVIDAGQGNTPNIKGVFELPIKSDGTDEDDEFVLINILSIENETAVNNYFGIVEDHYQHALTITDENLAPTVTLEILQRGIFVDEVDVDQGEVIIRAMVNDPNGEDNHTYEWDLAEFGVNMEISNSIRLDPSDWIAGEHEISLSVRDTGNPSMMTELVASIKVVKVEVQEPEDNGEGKEEEEEKESPTDQGTGTPTDQGGETPTDQGSEAPIEQDTSTAKDSGSGALGYGLFILLMLALYQRQRNFYKR